MDTDLNDLYADYVGTHIEGLTRGVSLRDAFIVVLRGVQEAQLFPLLIDREGFDRLTGALKHKDYTCSRLLLKMADRLRLTLLGVRIMQPHNGQYLALIDFAEGEALKSLTTSLADALVVALQSKATVYVKSSAFKVQKPSDAPSHSMALPIHAMGTPLLEEAMRGAVETDNFELATILRDELKKRDGADTASPAGHPDNEPHP